MVHYLPICIIYYTNYKYYKVIMTLPHFDGLLVILIPVKIISVGIIIIIIIIIIRTNTLGDGLTMIENYIFRNSGLIDLKIP